jgi:hypothetical protein
MLTAMRRASSRVTIFAAESPAGFVLEIDVGERVAVAVADDVAVLAELGVRVIDRPGRREAAPCLGLEQLADDGGALLRDPRRRSAEFLSSNWSPLSCRCSLACFSFGSRGKAFLASRYADCVPHGRGHFEASVRPDHTALSKLGLGFAERHHRDIAVSYSMGQSSSNSRLAAWRFARH